MRQNSASYSAKQWEEGDTHDSTILTLFGRVLDDDAVAEAAGRLERNDTLVLVLAALTRRGKLDRELLRADVAGVLDYRK